MAVFPLSTNFEGAFVLQLVADDTELFKQFSDNDSFKKWLSDAVFRSTYGESA